MGSHYEFVSRLEGLGKQLEETIRDAKLTWEGQSYHCKYLNAGLRQCTYPDHIGIACICDNCPLMLGLR